MAAALACPASCGSDAGLLSAFCRKNQVAATDKPTDNSTANASRSISLSLPLLAGSFAASLFAMPIIRRFLCIHIRADWLEQVLCQNGWVVRDAGLLCSPIVGDQA
ncbi:hypothetical protein D9M73_277220 [compost metagenome]